jgi:hypothetical protein
MMDTVFDTILVNKDCKHKQGMCHKTRTVLAYSEVQFHLMLLVKSVELLAQ